MSNLFTQRELLTRLEGVGSLGGGEGNERTDDEACDYGGQNRQKSEHRVRRQLPPIDAISSGLGAHPLESNETMYVSRDLCIHRGCSVVRLSPAASDGQMIAPARREDFDSGLNYP
jgi:hypothetical protein